MNWVVFWVIMAIFAACMAAGIAEGKGRSAGGWFVLGVLMGPMALAVALLPSMEELAQMDARQTGQAGGFRKCPYCAEAVRVEAVKCRYCQSELPPLAAREGRAVVGDWKCRCGRFNSKTLTFCPNCERVPGAII